MRSICSASITIIDMNDITSSDVAPDKPLEGMLWIDTSMTPPVLKVWQNGKWVIQSDETIGTSNLLKNTGLRKDTTGWSLSADVKRDTSKKKGSNNSLKYHVTGLTSDAWRSGQPERVDVDAFKRYSAACEVFIPANHGIDKGIEFEVQWFNSNGARVKTDHVVIDTKIVGRWQRVVLERLRVPSGAVKANARVWVRRNGSFYVAELMLTEGAKIGSWVAHKDDVQDEMEDIAKDTVTAQTQEEIFEKLTNYGASQGIFMDEKKNFYINGEYIRGENLNIVRHSDKQSTFKVTSGGEIEINAKKLSILGTSVATSNDVDNIAQQKVDAQTQLSIFNKLTNNGQTQGLYLKNNKLYLNGEFIKAGSIDADKIKTKSITADRLHADVLSANNIVSIINGGSTTISGNKITTGTITANHIATNTITVDKLAIGDFTNYSQLNDKTATKYGFTKQASEANGAWLKVNNMARDIFISDHYPCNGGETFRLKGDISTTVKGLTTNGGSTIDYRGAAIGIFAYDGNGTNVGYLYSTRVTNATKTVSSTITLPSTARKFRVYIQTEGWGSWSGELKVRNIQVTKMTNGELIVNGSVTADMITSGTFKGTNFIAGGSSSNGYVEVLDSSNSLIFKAQKGGVVSRKITFVNDVNSGFGNSIPFVTSINQDGVNMEYSGGIVSDGFVTHYYKQTKYTHDTISMTHSKRGENASTGSASYQREDCMRLTSQNITFEIQGDDGYGTFSAGLFGGTPTRLGKGYGKRAQPGIEVGLFESLQIGSHLAEVSSNFANAKVFMEIDANGVTVGDTAITSNQVAIKGTDTSGSQATCQLDAWNNSSFRIRVGGSGTLANKFVIQGSGDTNMALFTPTSLTVGKSDSNEKQIFMGVSNSSMTGRAGMYINTSNFGLYDWHNNRSILQYNHKTGLVNLMGHPAMIGVSTNGYYGLCVGNNTSDWIRSTVAGLIPYASGGNSSSLGTTSWPWKEIHGKVHYVQSVLAFSGGVGTNYLIAGATADGISYGRNNMRTRCHWGWGISDNGDTTNAVIDSRAGRFIGKSAYWHNSSKSLKSDVRAIVSEKEPMVARLYEYDTVDQNVTLEMIEDFLDSINVKTYVSDYKQDGVSQEEHDNSKAHITQLGYIADEFADHPLFKYVGEMIGEYHAINTTALISTLIAGYQAEKRKRMMLESKVDSLEAKINEIVTKLGME